MVEAYRVEEADWDSNFKIQYPGTWYSEVNGASNDRYQEIAWSVGDQYRLWREGQGHLDGDRQGRGRVEAKTTTIAELTRTSHRSRS